MWKVKYLLPITLTIAILLIAVFVTLYSGRQKPIILEYTFDEGTESWSEGFVDLPVNYEEDIYQLEFNHTDWPGGLGKTGKALMLSGNNASDDLFMYVRKQLGTADGLEPNTTYLVRFEVDFATNAPSGGSGIGGSPGEGVIVKVGAAPVEPRPLIEDLGGTPCYRLSVDKGQQNDDGANAIRIGNIAKLHSHDFTSYEIKALANQNEPLEAMTDKDGNLWVFVGTDSGFEGKTTLYYTRIQVTLEKQ
jgi:hypothetical protein